jgi:hypothetical protein
MKEYFDHGATDFYTLLTKLRASQADGVFVAAETQDGSILVKQLKEMGMKAKVFGVGSWATPDFIGLTGDASEGIYAAVPYASALHAAQPGLREDYARLQEQPGKYSAAGYNALNILMDAHRARRQHRCRQDPRRAAPDRLQRPNGKLPLHRQGPGYGFDVDAGADPGTRSRRVVATERHESPEKAATDTTHDGLLLQLLANGLVTGSFYALSALGLTLILGLMRVVNFAHGELYMLGGVLGWWVTAELGPGLLLRPGGGGRGHGRLRLAGRPLLIERIRDQGEEAGILLTIGLSIFLANTALLAVGTAPLKIDRRR